MIDIKQISPYSLRVENLTWVLQKSSDTIYLLTNNLDVELEFQKKDLLFSCQDNIPNSFHFAALLLIMAEVFCYDATQKNVEILLSKFNRSSNFLIRQGLADTCYVDEKKEAFILNCSRSTFWQNPLLWLNPNELGTIIQKNIPNGESTTILRPPKPTGEVYRRYIPSINSVFSMRCVSLAKEDVQIFHEWMNTDSIAKVWELTGSKEFHHDYLSKQRLDANQFSVFACFDDEPFGYFEFYWAKEDRIAPFYEVKNYDRGTHLLIGNAKHQGALKVQIWFRALMHYLFLDDIRTQRTVGEPRADNARFIRFLQQQGMKKVKEFDFPHKRAALMVLERDVFFEDYFPL